MENNLSPWPFRLAGLYLPCDKKQTSKAPLTQATYFMVLLRANSKLIQVEGVSPCVPLLPQNPLQAPIPGSGRYLLAAALAGSPGMSR